jgi:hypothetical protein
MMVGLMNVDDTSDLDKPISTATQTALDGKLGSITAGTNISVSGNEVSTSLNPIFTSAAIGDVSNTEIQYLSGVTSSIQTQIDSKYVLPSQSGNSGKYLTTNGTITTWETVSGGTAAESIHPFAMIG